MKVPSVTHSITVDEENKITHVGIEFGSVNMPFWKSLMMILFDINHVDFKIEQP